MRPLLLLLSLFLALNLTSCGVRTKSTPSNITVITKRPANYKIVRVNGKRYYFWNGRHYRKTRKGYVVVKV